MRIDRVKLAAALARADMTTVRLSERSGIGRATISNIKGGKSCAEETARKIAAGLNMPLEELLAKED